MLRHSALFAIMVPLLSAAWSWADSFPPPRTYLQSSPDGRFVFVMIPPFAPEQEATLTGRTLEEILKVRGPYSRSGLYRNDGSTNPLWEVDWYAQLVIVASDGVHLVRKQPVASHLNKEAISFYANGQLIRKYRIDELTDIPWILPRSVSNFRWLSLDSFDDPGLIYRIETKDGNSFRFDIRTGNIVGGFQLARAIRLGVTIVIALGLLGTTYAVWRTIRRKQASQMNREAEQKPIFP